MNIDIKQVLVTIKKALFAVGSFLFAFLYDTLIFAFYYLKMYCQFIIGFVLTKSSQIFYFLTRKLKTNELIGVGVFLLIFALFDRNTNRRVKYPRTKSPNILWRFFALIIYIPLWMEFVYPWALLCLAKIEIFKDFFYSRELDQFVDDFYIFRRVVEIFFRDRLGFLTIYQLVLYFGVRVFVTVIPKKFIRLPMFIKYHLINCSLLCLVADIAFQFFNFVTAFVVDNGIIDLRGMSLSWTFLYFMTIGRSTWDALRGRSYTGTFLDIAIKTHLGFYCLYDDERWADYGVDELENRDDFDDF